MADLLSRLCALQNTINVGVIDAGNIGKGIVQQVVRRTSHPGAARRRVNPLIDHHQNER